MTEEDIAQLARNVERAPVDVKVELGKHRSCRCAI